MLRQLVHKALWCKTQHSYAPSCHLQGDEARLSCSRAGCKLHSTLAVQEVHSVVSDRSLLASSSRKAFSEARSREPAHYDVVTILRCSVQKHPKHPS